MVILPAKEFEKLLEELEDIEDVRLYDKAKKNDNGARMPMKDAFEMIEARRKTELKKSAKKKIHF